MISDIPARPFSMRILWDIRDNFLFKYDSYNP